MDGGLCGGRMKTKLCANKFIISAYKVMISYVHNLFLWFLSVNLSLRIVFIIAFLIGDMWQLKFIS